MHALTLIQQHHPIRTDGFSFVGLSTDRAGGSSPSRDADSGRIAH